jgi:hypothetical protein
MPRIDTFLDLKRQNHTLGLYCPDCNRWGEADIDKLIASGRGERSLVESRFRCVDCGMLVDKQLRPPVPTVGGAVAYIRTGAGPGQ